MDDDNESAAKDALGLIKQMMRQRTMQRPRKEPLGGEVAPSDDDLATEEEESDETPAEAATEEEQNKVPAPEKKTVLESFVPGKKKEETTEMLVAKILGPKKGKQ